MAALGIYLLVAWTSAATLVVEAEPATIAACTAQDGPDCSHHGQAEGLEEEAALLQHMPAKADAKVAQEKDGIICSTYEVCKCVSGPGEKSTKCTEGTCRFDHDLGRFSPCRLAKPGCNTWIDWPSWKSCEWANFADTGRFPGDDVTVALGNKTFTSELLGGLSKVTVFSDMDDTIMCSGGGIAGSDTRCEGTQPEHMYPGVAEFQLALTLGPSSTLPKQLVVPVSARPHQLSWVLGMKADSPQNKAFKKVGGSDWGFDVDHALYGDLRNSLDFLPGFDGLTPFSRLAYTKYRRMKRVLKKLDLQVHAGILVGDDGQGDLVAAQMLLKAELLLASFIHDVRQTCADDPCRAQWAKHGIFLFENYVDAAGIAYSNGFISQGSCQRVCQAKGAEAFSCKC